MRLRSVLAIFFFLALPPLAAAQDPPELKPFSTTSSKSNSPPLALEIFYNPTLPPAYLMIHGADVKPRWVWTSRFAMIAGWQSPPGAKPIHAVRIASHWNGETADVKLSLLRGTRGMDEEESVSSHQLAIDESIIVSKLETHGVEAFRIKLITPKAIAPPIPNLENRTRSIEILKITPETVPLPAYRVTFRNLSEKEVVALKVKLVLNGAQGPLALFQGEAGRPLIGPNEAREQYISAHVAQNLGTSYAPGVPRASLMQVTSAVFADGSFEGDVGPACDYEVYTVTRIKWLSGMLSLFDEYRNRNLDEPRSALELRQKIAEQNFSYSAAEKTAPSKISERCPSPANRAENLTKSLSLKLINDLDVIITTRPKPLVTFGTWLESTRKTYRHWLASLELFRRGDKMAQ